ncbi:MAG: S1 RNA-binding domain-containing protein [Candidatus Margulisbacteria bacterium]|nr:S1 RNA-binding domain-containing protein [Candidatus Margulisiibacteriota bacterium]MBU1617278.1 S1 RNA-binding domain-containing protein [Candidatus Margulisiibacteriota bacterium]MBU1866902.1 S1 RNA-binding domain-containing protein [Candidatus Margulisiibacteriota bacterium]
MPLDVGLEVEGKVTGITNFGAFMELPEKLVGLVHISQVSDSYVTDITKHLRIGDVIKVKVLGVNKEGKYDLSIKQVGKAVFAPPRPKKPREEHSGQPGNFEDKITMFLKQSEEKLLDWKRNLEYKQVGKKKKPK